MKTKKISVFSLVLIFIFTSFAPRISAVTSSGTYNAMPDLVGMTEVEPFEYEFLPASSQWMELIADESPATLQATYELADNVLALDENQNAPGASLLQGSSCPAARFKSLNPIN